MSGLFKLDNIAKEKLVGEFAVSAYASSLLEKQGYSIRHQKTGKKAIDMHWPSKAAKAKSASGTSGAPTTKGAPDILVYLERDSGYPFCVWENKDPTVAVDIALADAKFYIEGLQRSPLQKAGLPRLAAGFNGHRLVLAYLNHAEEWVDVKAAGLPLVDQFPLPDFAVNGISSNGNFNAQHGTVSKSDVRRVLPRLKTVYRGVPVLASGRKPIDFTVALLTLKMLLESKAEWGTWAEQPALAVDAEGLDEAIRERFRTLVKRVLGDRGLKKRYGDIFDFREHMQANEEVAFSFLETLELIPQQIQFFERAFELLDELPPLHGADFDVFGEVYQAIGDDATKRALGEFFTGRHIISAIVPVLFERAGVRNYAAHLRGKRIADIACGTGGFLTETLRYVRGKFDLDEDAVTDFAKTSFYGYDLSQSNASRARVNMYFAGDGFSQMEGGYDSLAQKPSPGANRSFDFILTNPPYGSSSVHQRLEEAFLRRAVELLAPGSGWGLIVLPTGVLENPRSSNLRRELLQKVQITDVVSLPEHAFAPYTKQRTCLVIFQRRERPIGASDWSSIVEQTANEEIAFFIVDCDGYANSDKRYETNRAAPDGSWLHDDLSPWIDSSGIRRQSKLYTALIGRTKLKDCQNEFGEPLGPKYRVVKMSALARDCAERSGGELKDIGLLPDTFLRPTFGSLPLDEFRTSAEELLRESRSSAHYVGAPLRDRARTLLATRVALDGLESGPFEYHQVHTLFDLVKGDTGLTEAVIYQQFDPEGHPVYGGGESLPRFFLRAKSTNKIGRPITVHAGPALIVSMDGSSGSVRVVESGSFVANHHGCVLTPKQKNGGKRAWAFNLHCIAQQLEGGLRNMASNKSASATLSMPVLKAFEVAIPTDRKVASEIGKLRTSISQLRDKFG